MIDFLQNYLDNMAQTPEQYYHDLHQATIDARWEDTTLLTKIKEENIPFDDTYKEHEVWVDVVSDVTVNTLKVVGNYLNVTFKNIDHPKNYRGQKYKYTEAGRNFESTYLCYDMINPYGMVAETKILKCNNTIKYINRETGAICSEPVFVGWQERATNNLISKDGTTENRRLVCLIQKNKNTETIVENQRFMVSKKRAFKVTQVDDTNEENENEDFCTLMTLFVEWSPIMEDRDNLELGIADYYINQYSVEIDQNNTIEQTKGSNGDLTAFVKMNNEIKDMEVVWSTSNKRVITIDENGHYEIVGNVGNSATITCSIKDNENVKDTIDIEIIDTPPTQNILIVTPEITELRQGFKQEFECGIYNNGNLISKDVDCVANWNGNNYTLEKTEDNNYILTNNKISNNILTLTFSANGLQPIVMNIKLRGLF